MLMTLDMNALGPPLQEGASSSMPGIKVSSVSGKFTQERRQAAFHSFRQQEMVMVLH